MYLSQRERNWTIWMNQIYSGKNSSSIADCGVRKGSHQLLQGRLDTFYLRVDFGLCWVFAAAWFFSSCGKWVCAYWQLSPTLYNQWGKLKSSQNIAQMLILFRKVWLCSYVPPAQCFQNQHCVLPCSAATPSSLCVQVLHLLSWHPSLIFMSTSWLTLYRGLRNSSSVREG